MGQYGQYSIVAVLGWLSMGQYRTVVSLDLTRAMLPYFWGSGGNMIGAVQLLLPWTVQSTVLSQTVLGREANDWDSIVSFCSHTSKVLNLFYASLPHRRHVCPVCTRMRSWHDLCPGFRCGSERSMIKMRWEEEVQVLAEGAQSSCRVYMHPLYGTSARARDTTVRTRFASAASSQQSVRQRKRR